MQIIAELVTLFTFIGLCYAFWRKALHPHRIRTKLRRFYALVQDWFDTIDSSKISQVDMTALAVKAKKVGQFIDDHKLKTHHLTFTPSFRKRYLEHFQVRPDCATDPRLFEKYSKCPQDGLPIDTFWATLVGAFHQFKYFYDTEDPRSNIANVENRVRLLKMYTQSKLD